MFLRESFDFIYEDVLWKELLVFLLNSGERCGVVDFMKSLEPLPFDPGLVTDYLHCFSSKEKKMRVLGELEKAYCDVEDVGRS